MNPRDLDVDYQTDIVRARPDKAARELVNLRILTQQQSDTIAELTRLLMSSFNIKVECLDPKLEHRTTVSHNINSKLMLRHMGREALITAIAQQISTRIGYAFPAAEDFK